MRADWTASGACTSGSTAPPGGATRRASGCAATTSTTRAERSRGCRSSLPESLRWDAERPVEARGRVLPRDDHRQLGDGVVVVVLLQAREQLVVDVAVRLSDRVGVFERHLLRVAEERALGILVEGLDLLRRDAV